MYFSTGSGGGIIGWVERIQGLASSSYSTNIYNYPGDESMFPSLFLKAIFISEKSLRLVAYLFSVISPSVIVVLNLDISSNSFLALVSLNGHFNSAKLACIFCLFDCLCGVGMLGSK